jgi:hypothetical protein
MGHQMKIIFASLLLIGVSTVAANAETFTFTSTSHTVNVIAAPVAGGSTVGATFGTGKSATVYASGKKTSTTNECASWSTPPGSQFQVSGICVYTEGKDDKASLAFTCANGKSNTSGDCWGSLTGMAGRYTGKTGTISWHQSSPDGGKSGMAAGTGMWND